MALVSFAAALGKKKEVFSIFCLHYEPAQPAGPEMTLPIGSP